MIQDVSNIEQPKAMKMLKNVRDENSTDRDDYLEKLNEDLSCGDTIKNTEFFETDDKFKTGKQRDTAKIEKNDGRGDG